MLLSELKQGLNQIQAVRFRLPNGDLIPSHFHITEVGLMEKRFIDCGGTVRKDQTISLQLWTAEDYDHRLAADKMRSILELSEKTLALPDAELEVEYQGLTIEKFDLELMEGEFHLLPKHTDCLAKDNCGVPKQKTKRSLKSLSTRESNCVSGGTCC